MEYFKYYVHFDKPKLPIYKFKNIVTSDFVLSFGHGIILGLNNDYEKIENEFKNGKNRGYRQGQFLKLFFQKYGIEKTTLGDLKITILDPLGNFLEKLPLHGPKTKDKILLF